MKDELGSVRETRDMVVETAAQMRSHVADCFEVRKRNESLLVKIDQKIDEKIDKLDEKLDENTSRIYQKLDKLTWVVLPILGGLILGTHIVDWVVQLSGHK